MAAGPLLAQGQLGEAVTNWGGKRTLLEAMRQVRYAKLMFEKALHGKSTLLVAISFALISAERPPESPGRGVLCLGTFIYFAEKTGEQCRAGSDPEFQARIAKYARRFDDYIIRNTGGDPAILAKFKEGQNLNSEDHSYICEGDAAQTYDNFKGMETEELDGIVDELLARDGPPSFGDCV